MHHLEDKLLHCPLQVEESPSANSISLLKKFKHKEVVTIEEILKMSYLAPDTANSNFDLSLNSKHEDLEKQSSSNEVNDATCVDLSDKFPIKLKYDELMGRCLVAARDIQPGEIFLMDWPIITAPNAGESNNTTCLGCCCTAPSMPPCQRCGWPVCDDNCSNIPQHADYECKIFASQNIKQELPPPYCLIHSAEYIKILRCLLLREEDDPEKMTKWKQILALEAHLELRKNIPKVQFMSGLVKRFIRNICNLTMFDEPTIEFILGVVDVNAFRHSFAPIPLKPAQSDLETSQRSSKNSTFLYPQASMAAHGCIRNSDWKTLEDGQVAMRASHCIAEGQLILHAYVDLMLGTPERRRLLRKLFYFDCTCQRCQSPSENDTYFSALKCVKCKTGYLLAENPLEYKSNWICNNKSDGCAESKPYQYERELVQQILAEEKKVCDEIPNQTNLGTVKSLMKILKKHRNVTVHDNHYRIVSIEYLLTRHLLQIPKPAVEIMLEIKRLIKRRMALSAIFHPSVDDIDN